MRLDPDNPLDVYFAFRLAFVDRPEVRIRTVDRPSRPGYSRGRFEEHPQPVRVLTSTQSAELARDGLPVLRIEDEHHRHGALDRAPDPVGLWALKARGADASDFAREILDPDSDAFDAWRRGAAQGRYPADLGQAHDVRG